MTRRKRVAVELSDFGSAARLRRGLADGTIVIEGEPRMRTARTVVVIESFPIEAMREASALMVVFHVAQWHSFSLSRLQPRTSGAAVRDDSPTIRAESARRYLWKMHQAIGREHFTVLWHSLLSHSAPVTKRQR